MTAQKLLYVFSHGPYSNSMGQEGIDAVLSAASFEQQVSLLFLHDGVFQLKAGQDSTDSELKQVSKTFSALKDFGVQGLFVHDISMRARGLVVDDLFVEALEFDTQQIAELMSAQYRVFTF